MLGQDNSRPISADQNNPPLDPYGSNGLNGFGNPLNGLGGVNGVGFPQDSSAPLSQQQLQYQNYLAAQARGVSPAGMYPGMPGANYGYTGGSPSVENLRSLQTQQAPLSAAPGQMSPGSMLGQSSYPQQQFSPVVNPAQMYQYPPQYYTQAQAVQGQSGGGRRGRVSFYDSTTGKF
jgi:protein JSN1